MSNVKIAQVVGVSEATVSRVMNQQPGVSEATAQRVLEAAEALGMVPRHQRTHASALQHNAIALLVLSGDALQQYSWAFNQTLAGIEDALRARGLELLYARAAEPSQIPRRITAGKVDGAILAGTRPDAMTLDALAKLPSVWVCSRHDRGGDTALPGNNAVAQIAADYLLSRGHRALAMINPLEAHPAIETRFDYFDFFASRRGATVVRLGPTRGDAEGATSASDDPLRQVEAVVDDCIQQLLAVRPQPTGLFACTDMVAAMIYRALLKRGVKPGQDIEVIGCDNDATALAGLYPRPATIDIAPFTMGRRAVEQLLWRIAHPQEQPRVQVVIEPRLVQSDDV